MNNSNFYPEDLKMLADQYKNKQTSNLSRYNSTIYNKLLQYTDFLPNTASASQRLHHIENDLFEVPKCKQCDNNVNWINAYKPSRYADFCSAKCTANHPDTLKKRQNALKKHYGVDSFSKTQEFKEKIKNIDKEVWKQAQEKRKQTNLKKYGIEHAHLTKQAIEKRKQTTLKRYGHTNVLQSEYVKKIKRDKYGTEHYFNAPNFKSQRKKTMIDRYGVEFSGQSQELIKKREQTSLKKYGVKSFSQTDEFSQRLKEKYNSLYDVDHHMHRHISKDTIDKINNKDWLYEQHTINQIPVYKIAEDLQIDNSTLCDYFKRFNIPIQRFSFSIAEVEIYDFLSNYVNNLSQNIKTIISPYELDIFIPEHNLAIEHCGLYWHCSKHKQNSRYRHRQKLDACNEKGIRLITIFEDEWMHKQDIVKQKLLSILQKDDRKVVYARNCAISIVDRNEKRNFFNDNHIQGTGAGSINIGLLYNNELVACMSFIKQKHSYILNRYATSKRVVGGFSKLLKYFQRIYKWETIISFADLRWSNGNLYEMNGFVLDKTLSPDYEYVDLQKIKRIHKFNFRRHNLKKILKEKYDPTLSETRNTEQNRWFKIYNCGLLRYVMNESKSIKHNC